MTEAENSVFEVNGENFARLVLEKSKQIPVMVDFWAEWCAPCKMLTPVLEEVVRHHPGKIALAKLDVDQNQSLAAQFRIQSIPAVKIFREGKVAGEFIGARSRDEVEKIIESVLPDERAPEIEEANRFLSGGRWEEAAKIYEKVIGEDPQNSAAHLGLGMIAFHQARWDDAEAHLNRVESDTPGFDTVPAMRARIYFEKTEPGDLNEITAQLKKNPRYPQALYSLGLTYARGGEYERALDTLLQVIEVDRAFKDGAARDAYLKILDILGRGSEVGKTYSRKLSMLLFS